MASLQKFKLLATQCAIAGSPTHSPTTSPVIHLRRRKTLRMLLSRSSGGRRLPRHEESPDRRKISVDPPEKRNELVVASHKLKDLFVSSPPFEDKSRVQADSGQVGLGFSPATVNGGGSITARRGAVGSLRPISAAFRYRLLRRVWRPVLVSIPE